MEFVWLSIALFALGVLTNAFFAGYETGFLSVPRVRIKTLAEEEKNPNARRLLPYIERPERLITLVLVGTNLGMVMGSTALAENPYIGSVIATFVATPLVVLFGEIVPKSMFRAHAVRAVLFFAPLIRISDFLLAPLVLPITWTSEYILRLTRADTGRARRFITSPEEIRTLIENTKARGEIQTEESEMIHSVMELSHRQAKEIMIPRTEIIALRDTATRQELVALLIQTGKTHIPLYRGTIDHIVGIVNVFDVLTDKDRTNPDILRFRKDVLHVPDTMPLDLLLDKMRRLRKPIAIVTDEDGITDGLISIDDILEEIFGKLPDEHDVEKPWVRRIGENTYVLDGRARLDEIAETLGIVLEAEDVETLAGWVMYHARCIPQKGETLILQGYRVTILEGTPNGILSVRLEPAHVPEPPGRTPPP